MNVRLLLLLAAAGLAGCVSTPYQPSGMTGGFTVRQLRDDVWRVKFGGNGYTTRETAQSYWLYRAAELAMEKGFDGFELISQIPFAYSLGRELSGNRSFGFAHVTAEKPDFIPFNSADHPRHPLIEGDIRLLRKPFEAAPPRRFDAMALKSALESHVKGRKCVVEGKVENVCPHVHDYLLPKART